MMYGKSAMTLSPNGFPLRIRRARVYAPKRFDAQA